MMPVSRYLCIFINVGLGDIAKAGVGKGVASDNGFFTVPVLIAGVKTEFYVQWGKATVSNSTGVITLPVAFPNKRLLVLANDITESATSVVTFGINTDASKSSFTFFSAIGSSESNAGQFAWLAIGY
ncbi:phage tail protein [Escherichia coli]|nr:phage tail protein [Escherichia coli]